MSVNKFCTKCGYKSTTDNTFCVKCGNNLVSKKKPQGTPSGVVKESKPPSDYISSRNDESKVRATRNEPRAVTRNLTSAKRSKSVDTYKISDSTLLFNSLLILGALILPFSFIWGISILVVNLLLKEFNFIEIPFPRGNYDRSPVLLWSTIILVVLRLFQFDHFEDLVYIFYILIITLIVSFQQPPKYIIKNNYHQEPTEIYIIIGAVLAFFMMNASMEIGFIIYVIFLALQVFDYRNGLDLASIQTTSTDQSETIVRSMKTTRPVSQTSSSIQNLNFSTRSDQRLVTGQSFSVKNVEESVEQVENDIMRVKTHISQVVPSFQGNENQINTTITELELATEGIEKQEANPGVTRRQFIIVKQEAKALSESQKLLTHRLDRFTTTSSQDLTRLEEKLNFLTNELKSISTAVEENVTSLSELDLDPQRQRIEKLISTLNDRIEATELIISKNQKLKQEELQRLEEEKEASISTTSVQFRALINEKIISNLFAYIGAIFVISGFIYGMNYSYINFIEPTYGADALKEDAQQGAILLYLFSLLMFTIPAFLVRKFASKYKMLPEIMLSVGVPFIQFSLWVNTFFFDNLDFDSGFPLLGMAIASSLFLLAFQINGKILSVMASQFMLWTIHISAENQFVSDIFISTLYLTFLGIVIAMMIIRKHWLPLAIFDFFVPATVYLNNSSSSVWAPEILVLLISIINVYLMIKDKFPTPKPFANFLTTVSLMYPNFLAYLVFFDHPNLEFLDTLAGGIYITLVFMGFFALYWLYIVKEQDLYFAMKVPISVQSNQISVREFHRRINWIMLLSLIVPLLVAGELASNDINLPILMFATSMSFFAILTILKNFEELVTNSVIFTILEAEFLYLMYLTYEGSLPEGWAVPILSAMFLLSFTSIIYILDKKLPTVRLFTSKVRIDILTLFITMAAVLNFIAASVSEFEAIVVTVAIVQFLVFFDLRSKNKEKLSIHANILYQYMLGLIGIFAFTGFRLTIDGEAKYIDENGESNASYIDHIFLNLPFIIVIGFLFYVAIVGRDYQFAPGKNIPHKDQSAMTRFEQLDQIYAVQILLNLLPVFVILYGVPYFYKPQEMQALLGLYIMVYFLALPLLVAISNRRSENFGILSSLSGYFMVLISFITLGAASRMYDNLLDLENRYERTNYTTKPGFLDTLILDIDLAILLFATIFLVSVAWTIFLSIGSEKKFQIKSNPQKPTTKGGDLQ